MWRWVETVNWIVAAGATLLLAIRIWRRTPGWEDTGGEPACPRCHYVVIGLSGTRCPECGNDLEQSGIVRLGKRRLWWRIFPLGMWTLFVLSGGMVAGMVLGCMGMVGFIDVREESVTHPMAVQLAAGGLTPMEMRAHGVGYGGKPVVDELLVRFGSEPERRIWRRGSEVQEQALQAWLTEKGVARPPELRSELVQVAKAAAGLETLEEFEHRERWPVTNNVGEVAEFVAGVQVKQMKFTTGRRRQSESGWLFTPAPWVFAGMAVAWLWGPRGLWPARRREAYVRAAAQAVPDCH